MSDDFNMTMRKFLKQVGVTSQQAIEEAQRQHQALSQQARVLEGVQRIFKYWHAAHKPFAVTAVLAVLLHVAVAVAMGVTWVW